MPTFRSRSIIFAAALSLLSTGSALATPPVASPDDPKQVACGGDLGVFLEGVKAEAAAKGVPAAAIEKALAGAQIDPKVLSRDRAQGVFRQTFLEFSQRTVSQARLDIGRKKLQELSSTFARAENEFGIPAGVIAAFWAMETDFGAVQGDFNTRNALVTLSHDCRRPELFRPQLLALIEMVQHGDLDPTSNTGAWAGEIGQVQMLPKDIIAFGIDTGQGQGFQRVVYLSGSHPPANVRLRHGDSRGHFEGNTLVVETTNFSPNFPIRGAAEHLTLVERLTRLNAKTLEYAVTMTDPTVWTAPWTAKQELTMQSDTENRIYYEPRCHEGNYGLPALLVGARLDDQKFKEGKGPNPASQDTASCLLNPENPQ